jgi:hypothetical protein
LHQRTGQSQGDGLVSRRRAQGGRGSADVVNLPQVGIRGNSHMIMMDKNNDQVADVIQKWLADKGLYR